MAQACQAVYSAGLTSAGQGFSVIGDGKTLTLEPEIKSALGLAYAWPDYRTAFARMWAETSWR